MASAISVCVAFYFKIVVRKVFHLRLAFRFIPDFSNGQRVRAVHKVAIPPSVPLQLISSDYNVRQDGVRVSTLSHFHPPGKSVRLQSTANGGGNRPAERLRRAPN